MNKVLISALLTIVVAGMFKSGGSRLEAAPSSKLEKLRLRASAWFTHEDKKLRRKQMRVMTRALKQPCKYCHTKSFKGFTDKYEISLRMMALSAEHNVACGECHLGKKALSPLGKQSQQMMTLSERLGVECTECHVERARFKKLTPKGLEHKEAIRIKQEQDTKTQ